MFLQVDKLVELLSLVPHTSFDKQEIVIKGLLVACLLLTINNITAQPITQVLTSKLSSLSKLYNSNLTANDKR